jgi:flagellar motor switch protein FliM
VTKEFLTQDEVDALLKGVTGDTDEGAVAEGGNGIRPYNLATQERIVRGRMPTLEIINERFARLLRIGLFNFMRRSAEISVGPVRVQKYGEFIRNLVQPTNLNLVQVKPLRGTGLFVFDPSLVFLVVDNLFGGDGRFHMRVEGREFTQTEQRIIQRLLEVVFENYEKSWKPVFEVKFEYMRAEMNTQFANIATPNEVVITTTFTVEFGASTADLHICLPYSMLEPIRDVLYSSLQGDHMEADRRWVRLLSKQVQSAEVEVVADLGTAQVSLGDVMKLKTGDVIPLNIPRTLYATVDNVQVMECHYGVFNGQYALRVVNMINNSQQDGAADSNG